MRPGAADALVAAGGAAGCGAAAALGGHGPSAVAGSVIVGGALGLVRGRPRAAWLLATAGLLMLVLDSVEIVLVAVALHAFAAGRAERPPLAYVAPAALVGTLELGVLVDGGAGVPALLVPLTAWATGRVLHDREQVVAQLADRARDLDAERAAHARLSVRYERARIASDLHDIVAHAISVMVVQAGAGQRLAGRDAAAAADTLRHIGAAARQAEADMTRLVALLADDPAPGPAPDLALVEELVRTAAASGLHVTLQLDGDRGDIPPAVGETLFRVVQEGLTNALRYAAGADVVVAVRGERAAVDVEVANGAGLRPGPAAAALSGTGTGSGLRGLRERVAAAGGTLEAGRSADGGWRVAARLPRG